MEISLEDFFLETHPFMINERAPMCIKFSLSHGLPLFIYDYLWIITLHFIWQDDEATLSEEEELAKKDDPDTSDEVISHVHQYCC
jgi:hypothetical protein